MEICSLTWCKHTWRQSIMVVLLILRLHGLMYLGRNAGRHNMRHRIFMRDQPRNHCKLGFPPLRRNWRHCIDNVGLLQYSIWIRLKLGMWVELNSSLRSWRASWNNDGNTIQVSMNRSLNQFVDNSCRGNLHQLKGNWNWMSIVLITNLRGISNYLMHS